MQLNVKVKKENPQEIKHSQTIKKNLYEGMYIISAKLSDDARINKALEKIKHGITSRGGEVLKVHDQGTSPPRLCDRRPPCRTLLRFSTSMRLQKLSKSCGMITTSAKT